jgi:hypothetical protein
MLPDPEVLRLGVQDDVTVPSSQHLEGATSIMPDYVPLDSDDSAREKLVVFEGKMVMLSWDLAITERLREIIKTLISDGGGELVTDVEKCDMFICQYRDGEQYIRASQERKDVGSLSWLYHLITRNEWTSPVRRLLHYPVPKDGLPGFKDMRVTLSNYGGEARVYLENLATACGATYTKTMKADNTHLITARLASEKVEAAKDWNLVIVNHLWLEESYAKCELQSATVLKYQHFPHRTNLGEIIGQTPFDMTRLRALYYPGGEEEEEEEEVEDVTAEVQAEQARSSKRKRNGAKGAPDEEDTRGGTGLRVLRDDNAEPNAKPKSVEKLQKDYATPIRGRYIRSGKENDTPSVISTGSRSAKANALNKIQDLAPDIALYEKERKRHSKDAAAPWGGKRAATRIEKEKAEKAAARSSSVGRDEEDEAEEESKRPAKKQKSSLPPVEMRIVLTGYQRWVGDKHKEDVERVSYLDPIPCSAALPELTLHTAETPGYGHSHRSRRPAMRISRRSPDGQDQEIPRDTRERRLGDRFGVHRRLSRKRRSRRPAQVQSQRHRKRETTRRQTLHLRLPRAEERRPPPLGRADLLHGRHPQRARGIPAHRRGQRGHLQGLPCAQRDYHQAHHRRGRWRARAGSRLSVDGQRAGGEESVAEV